MFALKNAKIFEKIFILFNYAAIMVNCVLRCINMNYEDGVNEKHFVGNVKMGSCVYAKVQ